MIARALVQQPSVLLLDEPTAFLDLAARLELVKLLLSLTHEHGLAVLMSTHDAEHLLRHADSVWLITPERELITGAPEELGLGGHLRRMLGDTAACATAADGGRLTEGGAICGRRRWPSSPAGWWTRPRAPPAL